MRVAELLVLHGELVDRPDEGRNISAELCEFLVLAGDRLPEGGDGGPEPGLVLVVRAAFPDALVELVLQVGVPLGECVAGNAGLKRERDDGRCPVGLLGVTGVSAKRGAVAAALMARRAAGPETPPPF